MPSPLESIVFIFTIAGVVSLGRAMVDFNRPKKVLALALIPFVLVSLITTIIARKFYSRSESEYYFIVLFTNVFLTIVYFFIMSNDNKLSLLFSLLTQLNVLGHIIYLSLALARLFGDSMIMVLFFRTILFAGVILLFKFSLKKKYRDFVESYHETKGWLILILIPSIFFAQIVATALYPTIIFDRPRYMNDLMIISGQAMIIIYGAIFYIFGKLVEKYKIQAMASNAQVKLAYWKVLLDNQNDSIEQTRKFRHDIRHHYAMMLSYLNDNKIEEAKEYLKRYSEHSIFNKPIQYCKNYTINSLLFIYLNKAESLKIKNKCEVEIRKDIVIDEIRLTTILANVLENALEACKRNKDKENRLEVDIKADEMLKICIKNTCVNDIQFDKYGFPESTKEIKSGIGTRNVASTIEALGGMVDYSAKDGIFTTRIVVPN